MLKQLVLESYTEGELDTKKVNKIADLLSKKELRLYIRALKNWERQHEIILEVPSETDMKIEEFKKLFPDKKIVINVDPELMLGLRLQDNDDIYELSLKNSLDKITEHITEQYD